MAKAPIVIYEFFRDSKAHLGFGYLLVAANGESWCYPSEGTISAQPDLFAPFQLDSRHLQEVEGTSADRRLFRYLGEVKNPRLAHGTPQPTQGRYQDH